MKRFESGFKKIVEKGQYMKHQPIRVFWKGTQYGKMVEMGPKGKQCQLRCRQTGWRPMSQPDELLKSMRFVHDLHEE